MKGAIRELRELYRAGRLLPFVGAGASVSVEWAVDGSMRKGPTWEELALVAAREMGFEEPRMLRARGTDLQIFEYFRAERGSMGPLVSWMIKNMQPPDEVLRASKIHCALTRLERCRSVYTTNFDDFLERTFRLAGKSVSVIADEHGVAQSYQHDDWVRIVKFHGDWEHPEEMVLTEGDYERRLRLDKLADSRLISDLAGRAVLFVGYSFRDPNVSYLFRLFQERQAALPLSPPGRRAYIVVADPSSFERVLFAKRNIEVVAVPSGDSQTDAVAGILDAIVN